MRLRLGCLGAVLSLLPAILFAGDPPVSYTRFCVTCGLMGVDTIASFSGQFVVHGSTLPLPSYLRSSQSRSNFVEVTPQLVAITGERVKRGLLDELDLPDRYQQKIHVIVMPLAPPEEPITIVSRIYTDGIVFQMGVPGQMDYTRLIKGLVQVLLADVATRGVPRNAVIPPWLVEGMSQHLSARVAPTIVANKTLMTYEISGYDRLRGSREVLETNTCLTFHALSFPKSPMNPAEARVYESSAHLFLAELLRLPQGQHLLAEFLRTLPQTLNWQTAFYRVFNEHFQTPLDVEKWWALSWFDIKSREEQQIWPAALSLQKLNNLLVTTLEVRARPDELPGRRDVSLQDAIQHLHFPAQSEVLSEKMRQMFFLQFNMAAETRQLLEEYRSAIEDYLERRGRLGSDSGRRVERLVRSTQEAFDKLDRKRESLRMLAGTP